MDRYALDTFALVLFAGPENNVCGNNALLSRVGLTPAHYVLYGVGHESEGMDELVEPYAYIVVALALALCPIERWRVNGTNVDKCDNGHVCFGLGHADTRECNFIGAKRFPHLGCVFGIDKDDDLPFT